MDCKLSSGYFRDELGKLSIQDLWKIIEELSHDHGMPDNTKMNYGQVLELCIKLKEVDQVVRNLAQITILQKELEKEDKING